MKLSQRAKNITPFFVMELLEKARSMEANGQDVVHMEVGEPSFPTIATVKTDAVKAIRENRTAYTHSLGIPELRERVSGYYASSCGVSIPPERIVITNGTSGALLLLFGVLLERGSLLAVSDPGYPCYKNLAAFMDSDVLQIPVSAGSNYEIGIDQLERNEKPVDVLVIANPSNPTGSIYKENSIENLYGYLSLNSGLLVVDEIYSGLYYTEKPKTALTYTDKIIVIDGFSKTYAMTGFRLGWMVVPEEIIRPIQRCAQNVFISPPSISQYGALSAFNAVDEIENMRKIYEKRRNYLVPRLRNLGFSVPIYPEGAFYVYAGIEKWGLDSMVFVERALEEARVAITPGYDFGVQEAGGHVRFSYADEIERLDIGCHRLELWLKNL